MFREELNAVIRMYNARIRATEVHPELKRLIPTGKTPFLGRDPEMQILNSAFERAASGEGELILVSGSTGIGKSRLLDEFVSAAKKNGQLVLRGWCYNQIGVPPFWPWNEIIVDAQAKIPTAKIAEFASADIRNLARAFPSLGNQVSGTEAQDNQEDASQFQTLDATARLLSSISRFRPTIIVIEELQWADTASFELLDMLTTRIQSESILVVCGWSDSETMPELSSRNILANLSRRENVHQIRLTGLQPADAKRFIDEVSGVEIPLSTGDAVIRQTQANPYFLAEIAREIGNEVLPDNFRANGIAEFEIPETVAEVILRTIIDLSAAAQSVLTFAAMLGRDFNIALLQAIDPELGGDNLLSAIDEVIRSGELREFKTPIARYRLRHPLISAAILSSIDLATKTNMHALFAHGLEEYYQSPVVEHTAEIAEHLRAAGSLVDLKKTGEYAVLAGTQALDAEAFQAAAKWFDVALSPEIARELNTGTIAAANDGRKLAVQSAGYGYPSNAVSNGLTARQEEVLMLVAEGLSNKEIGDRLFITSHAVATHIANIRNKYPATNRVELAALAAKLRLSVRYGSGD